MKCKYCGAELLNGSQYCVQCGGNNGEDPEKKKKTAEKFFLTAAGLFIAASVILAVFAALVSAPQKPEASYSSGTYGECISVSFSAHSGLFPMSGDSEIYVSADDSSFARYTGEEYFLNQVKTYHFRVYTVNSVGVKSAEKEYEYIMDIPKPSKLEVSVEPGTYTDFQNVKIISDDGSDIYYTLDGSEPTENSQKFMEEIALENGTTIIKAFAVNGAGTVGETESWTYVLNLPVPGEVSYSVQGGVYYDAFSLELSSEGSSVIYYTLDGSEPTENSQVYSEPLEITGGMVKVNAVAMNNYHIFSGVASARYAVVYNKYGTNPRTAAADGYYGAVGSESVLMKYDEQMNVTENYGISNVTSLYSDGKNIYYLAGGALCKLTDGEGVKLIDMTVDMFALMSDKLFFVSADILYSMDFNGENLEKYDAYSACKITGVWDGNIYFYNAGTAYIIQKDTYEFSELGSVTADTFFPYEGSLYYISGGSLLRLNGGDGSVTAVKEKTSAWYNLDPDYEWINSTDKSKTVTTFCTNLFACHNTLYVLLRTVEEFSTYHLITKTTDLESNSSYEWYAYDLNTGNLATTDIHTVHISVFENCIIDGDNNMHTVVQ